MKVQCDVCAAEAASVFCCADEAALCDACDDRVHRANKLAGKHRRFSLLHPCSSSAQKPPLCDICQERRGFLFCKEDRAILCRECDAPVHSANDMTRRHSRFLLTGVRLSSAPVDSADPSEGEEEEEQENSSRPGNGESCSGGAGAGATTATASDGSSISEYLTKTLPGWHVEDFLVDDAYASDVGACSDGLYQGQDGQISGVLQEAYMPWTGRELVPSDVADERDNWERWVPQMHAEFAGDSKRPRASPSPPCSYW
ncbi:B-box zinc finger protein 21 [Zea mays]|uniref:B-box zinc finger protein 21 n=2 Tax=Zea mays TaxID=4577 RepID=A0A8J8XJJ3_MAIZE|nr:salt tolerance-like protein [Zea mays]PWZ44877.1 B-box zinc finger protein 21 [Zea mays]|eukprot:NP_001151723.1 salt tolerance-like protein [Zea mays]